MKTFETMNLQLFADAGTLVNATGNYVNAYDLSLIHIFRGTSGARRS